jgi:hypothetical protein
VRAVHRRFVSALRIKLPSLVGRGSGQAITLASLAASLLLPVTLEAGLAEPDNLVYGTLQLDGHPVTAIQTDIVIEVRRTPDGPALATYRMGDEPRLGDFYRLKVRLEAAPPLSALEASLAGDRLYLVARRGADVLVRETLDVGSRALITRRDLTLANANPDQDGNGLPDAWELLHFSQLANDPQADPDQDGHSTLEEFLAGTAPNDPQSVCRLEVELGGAQPLVSFLARRAQGAGAENLVRRYTLEAAPLLSGPWTAVPGFTAIAGANQVVTHPIPVGTLRAFYRVRLSLESMGSDPYY